MGSRKTESSRRDLAFPVAAAGAGLFLLEIWKQAYLYFVYFHRSYDVWYFPFQLCSLPMYLSLLYLALPMGSRWKEAILLFLQDFGLLGGVAALLVPDGFTYPDYPLLTAHGYFWHLAMVGMAAFIIWKRLAPTGPRAFLGALSLFLPAAAMAEGLDILLHPLGDCDMFYISPYHPSSQIIFHEIDLAIGRPLGILLYLLTVLLGAFLIHMGVGCLPSRHRLHISSEF